MRNFIRAARCHGHGLTASTLYHSYVTMPPIKRLAFMAVLFSLAIIICEAGKKDKIQVEEEPEPIDPEEGLRAFCKGTCRSECCVPRAALATLTRDLRSVKERRCLEEASEARVQGVHAAPARFASRGLGQAGVPHVRRHGCGGRAGRNPPSIREANGEEGAHYELISVPVILQRVHLRSIPYPHGRDNASEGAA